MICNHSLSSVAFLWLLLLFSLGCDYDMTKSVVKDKIDKARQKATELAGQTWHQRNNWNAEDFFEQVDVVKLCLAIEARDLKEMQRLIDLGVDVNTLGKDNMTPLLWAFPDDHPDRLELLLKAGADPNVYFKGDFGVPGFFQPGESVTHLACRSQFDHFKLVFKYGGDPNLPNKSWHNRSPAFEIFRGTDISVRLKTLIKLGIDVNQHEHIGAGGDTLLMKLAWREEYELCLFLIQSGADPIRFENGKHIARLIHRLAGRQVPKDPKRRGDYDKLVAFLESKGESIVEAKRDSTRWTDSSRSRSERKRMIAAEGKRNRQNELERLRKQGEN